MQAKIYFQPEKQFQTRKKWNGFREKKWNGFREENKWNGLREEEKAEKVGFLQRDKIDRKQ